MKSLRVAVVLTILLGNSNAALTACTTERFTSLLPSGAALEKVTAVANGSAYGEGAANIAYPINPTGLPELCSIIVNVTSSPRSSYRFGLFLPTQWNSRFMAVGTGGFSGGINWLDMGARVVYGFATLSTDTGHNSTVGDVSWALGNDDKKTDFGFRAMHGSVVLAKQLAQAYYASNISYSYYSGCSTGGRQGLKEAEMFPDSFDGVLAGAPAWWTSHLQTWTTKVGAYNLPVNASNHVPDTMYPVIADEAIRQCDGADGVPDGIISAPDKCDFKVEALACSTPGVNQSACLTDDQVQTVKNIYADYYAEGKFAFPGLNVGSEQEWFVILSGTEPSPLGEKYINDFLFDDPDWTWQSYNDSIVWIADREDPGSCTADNYDLSAFKARGGKIIMYHGTADGLISTGSSPYFYEQVAKSMDGGVAALRSWFRFFFVPGMGHCAGTPVDAPWYIASGNQAGVLGTSVYSVPGFEDAQHDALLALMDWVENGTVVDQVVATTWKTQTDAISGVLRQRPLCPYPQTAQWNQIGDEKEVSSWNCSYLSSISMEVEKDGQFHF